MFCEWPLWSISTLRWTILLVSRAFPLVTRPDRGLQKKPIRRGPDALLWNVSQVSLWCHKHHSSEILAWGSCVSIQPGNKGTGPYKGKCILKFPHFSLSRYRECTSRLPTTWNVWQANRAILYLKDMHVRKQSNMREVCGRAACRRWLRMAFIPKAKDHEHWRLYNQVDDAGKSRDVPESVP